jgi:L-alanine-DL-glutamate epimerase-like enolase superfamily enzyme
MQLVLHQVELPLRHAFTISHGTQMVQHHVIVELQDGGHSGYGEGCEMEYYGQTPQRITTALERARLQTEAATIKDPTDFWAQMQPLLADEPFALCALDQAAHDLWGKRRGQPVYKLWGLSLGNCPASDYTIGIDPIERMVMKLNEFPGWPIYKIKLGTEHDLAIVAELRKHTDATFRVDANCGWTVEQTLRNAPELTRLNVQFIEQPLPHGQWEGYRRLRQESALPIIADESCLVEADVERCSGYFHGINIKLSKAGGMTPARRMIHTARRLGLKVMMGCMTESTVGISAIAQFLPLLDYVDMDGAVLLAKDSATGVRLERGRAIFPDDNGNGVRLLAQ